MPTAIAAYPPKIRKGLKLEAQFCPAGSVNERTTNPTATTPTPAPITFQPRDEIARNSEPEAEDLARAALSFFLAMFIFSNKGSPLSINFQKWGPKPI